MHDALALAVADDLGVAVRSLRPLGGGDVALSYRVELVDGEVVFAKTHRDPPPGFFTTEANGLRWLAAAEALPVAEVLAVDDGDPATGAPARLVLAWIDEGRAGTTPDGEAALGRGLAALHRAGAPCFGREDRRPTGSRSLPNDPADSWAEFYAQRRLLPLAALAAAQRALPGEAVDALREVASRLDAAGAADEPPARLHGDLWAGNRLVGADGRSWLIDPAAHGGHREFDLAMMRLFGGFGPEAFAAYEEAHPLAVGWEERIALHQLAPLAVHAIKFGGSYVAATERALARSLALR